ncbi:MAG TPA: c-type cytochrome [Angustibacter sp.]|nr:c-type cytochrome [Angustibacter sp.]
MRSRTILSGALVGVALAVTAACGADVSRIPAPQVPGGDPKHGAELIASYGCGSCHTVDGVRGADGLVGPPLTGFGQRGYIAGELPNSAENLEHWIQSPQQVEPGTAMPDLGVTSDDARDIAAFLMESR